MKNIIESLQWRYATRAFDTEKKLTEEQIDILLEAARLAPSSFGLQPWKFIVVTNPEVRSRLKDVGYGQAKITEASHLVVFAIEKNVDANLVEKFMQSIVDTRGVTRESLQGYADSINAAILSKGGVEGARGWATRQVYIALGVFLSAAATLGIDAGPMEGFDPKKFDEILCLEALGLESKVIAAVGFRKENDPVARMPKVRFPKEEVVITIK